jgi:hypothetical protein
MKMKDYMCWFEHMLAHAWAQENADPGTPANRQGRWYGSRPAVDLLLLTSCCMMLQ